MSFGNRSKDNFAFSKVIGAALHNDRDGVPVGQSKIGGDLLKQIINKPRQDPNLELNQYGRLTPAKVKWSIETMSGCAAQRGLARAVWPGSPR